MNWDWWGPVKGCCFQIRISWMSQSFMISSRSYRNYIQRCLHTIRTLNLQSFHGFKPLCLCCASDILLAILPIASSPMLSQLSSTRIGLDSICMAAMNQLGTPTEWQHTDWLIRIPFGLLQSFHSLANSTPFVYTICKLPVPLEHCSSWSPDIVGILEIP